MPSIITSYKHGATCCLHIPHVHVEHPRSTMWTGSPGCRSERGRAATSCLSYLLLSNFIDICSTVCHMSELAGYKQLGSRFSTYFHELLCKAHAYAFDQGIPPLEQNKEFRTSRCPAILNRLFTVFTAFFAFPFDCG